MMLMRLLVIGLASVVMVLAFISTRDNGDTVNSIAAALDAKPVVKTLNRDVGGCMPNSIGDIYFQISTPSNFCYCLQAGKNDEKEIIASGSNLKDYKVMCVDVNYQNPSLRACSSINATLQEKGKKFVVDCSCFWKSVKQSVVSIASYDVTYKSDDLLTVGFDQVVGLDNSTLDASKYYRLSDGIVERCTK